MRSGYKLHILYARLGTAGLSETMKGPLQSERIRLVLADEITGGRLLPGQHLDELQLGMRLGLSRTPVRKALRRFATYGLVEMRSRRDRRPIADLSIFPGKAERVARVHRRCQ